MNIGKITLMLDGEQTKPNPIIEFRWEYNGVEYSAEAHVSVVEDEVIVFAPGMANGTERLVIWGEQTDGGPWSDA